MNDDGSVLSGEALERYAKRRGLCHICANTQTHQPRTKFLKRLRNKKNWEPITVTDDHGELIVYKGFCIQPTCYSLKQAKMILGEPNTKTKATTALTTSASNSSRTTDGTHEMTSVELSLTSATEKSPVFSPKQKVQQTPTMMEALTSFTSLPVYVSERSLRTSSTSHHSSECNNSVPPPRRSVSDGPLSMFNRRSSVQQHPGVSSSSTIMSQNQPPSVGRKLLEYLNDQSPSATTTLDLSKVKLSSSKSVQSLLTALSRIKRTGNRALPTCLVLNHCKLNNHSLVHLIKGLEKTSIQVPSLSLRHNRISKKGLVAVSSYLSTTVQDLDLSKNKLLDGSEAALFGALLSSTKIQNLNLARTKLWECSLTALHFFRTNSSLQVLNLEGNSLRDSSIIILLQAMKENANNNKSSTLQTLLLADNLFGDEGLVALTELMSVSSTLRKISIGNNEITNKGATVLLQTLRNQKDCKAPLECITGLQDNRISDTSTIDNIGRQLEVMLHNRSFFRENKNGTVIQLGDITFCSKDCDRGRDRETKENITAEDTGTSQEPTPFPSPRTQRRFVIGGFDDESALLQVKTKSKHSPRFQNKGGNSRVVSPSPMSQAKINTGGENANTATPQSSSVFQWIEKTYSTVSSTVSIMSDRSSYNSDMDSAMSATSRSHISDDDVSSLHLGSEASETSLVDPKDYILSSSSAATNAVAGIDFDQSFSILFDGGQAEEDEPVEQGFEIDLSQFNLSLSSIGAS